MALDVQLGHSIWHDVGCFYFITLASIQRGNEASLIDQMMTANENTLQMLVFITTMRENLILQEPPLPSSQVTHTLILSICTGTFRPKSDSS